MVSGKVGRGVMGVMEVAKQIAEIPHRTAPDAAAVVSDPSPPRVADSEVFGGRGARPPPPHPQALPVTYKICSRTQVQTLV